MGVLSFKEDDFTESYDNHKYKNSTIIFQYEDSKCAIGTVKWRGKIGEEKRMAYGIDLKRKVENSIPKDIISKVFKCDNEYGLFVEDTQFKCLELDDKGIFVVNKTYKDIIFDDKDCGTIFISIKDSEYKGFLIKKGKVNDIKCMLVELEGVNHVSSAVENESIFIVPDILYATYDEITPDYNICRYAISDGDEKGIAAYDDLPELNSLLFIMFCFSTVFDPIFYRKQTKSIILLKEVVLDLRRHEYVKSDKLKSFVENERIFTETKNGEFLELFLKTFLNKRYFFRTIYYNGKDCDRNFVMDLSGCYRNMSSVSELLREYMSENKIKFKYPTKCLILKMPNKSKPIKIEENLFLDDMVIDNKCFDCTKTGEFICEKCGEVKSNIVLYCEPHNDNCSHEKVSVDSNWPQKSLRRDKVKLELFGVLCENSIAYVKTNEVCSRWVRFDGRFESIEKTSLHEYFLDKRKGSNDVNCLESKCQYCFYKYTVLEFYSSDYNCSDLSDDDDGNLL